MKKSSSKLRIIFCTWTDFKAGNDGGSVNDKKLFRAIPSDYDKIAIYPKFTDTNKIELKSIFKGFIHYIKEIVSSNKIFITRAPKLALLPIIMNKVFNNKVVIRMGCTPVVFIERRAFFRNLEFKSQRNPLKRLFYFIEPHLELYAIRHADKFIIENERAKKIAIFYGADPKKIKIIPYYVQNYFLKGDNPDFNKNRDIFKIGYTGRFSLYDLTIPVINAVSLLNDDGFQIELFLIGDGINRKNIENFVKEKGLTQNVIFLGSKSHKDVAKIINEYHCLVLPMLNSICPSTIAIKILEGVMRGKIIITTNSGNNSSLFLQHKELILRDSSVESITNKIRLVIKNYNKYRKIAEELSTSHKKLRSEQIYQDKIKELLYEIKF